MNIKVIVFEWRQCSRIFTSFFTRIFDILMYTSDTTTTNIHLTRFLKTFLLFPRQKTLLKGQRFQDLN